MSLKRSVTDAVIFSHETHAKLPGPHGIIMRQSFIVIFIFCTFLFVIGYFPVDFSNKLQPELFIDPEVLVVSKNYNFVKRVNNFQKTPLADALDAIDYSLISTVFDRTVIDPEAISRWGRSFDSMLEHPLILEIFGKEFTIALLDAEKTDFSEKERDLLEAVLVIARPRHHARIIELFSDFIDQDESVSEARYGGYVIKRIPVEDKRTIAVTRVKDLLLMSFSERVLRKSLDFYDHNISLLSEVKDYSRITGQLKNCASITYINVKKSLKTFTKTMNYPDADQLFPSLPDKLRKFSGYEQLIWGTWDNKDYLAQKAVLLFSRDEILPEYRELFTIEPGLSEAFKRINGDTIWYYWTNILRPNALLALYTRGQNNDPEKSHMRFISEIAETVGLSSEELFSLIENDLLIALENSPEEQFIPIPHLLLALKTNDAEQLLAILEKVTDFYGIPLIRQSINGVGVYLWGGVVPTGDLQPTFCITDDYFVFSSNRKQIREFILAGNGYQSLHSNPEFKLVNNGLTAENNSVNYIDSQKLTVLVKEVLSWIGTMIAIQDREAAKRSKILIDQLLNPLLDGLAMYSTVGMRSYSQENSIIIESKILKHYGTD